MSFRKIAIRSASSFPGFALAGLLAAGLAASPVRAATTTYASAYSGGTINPGDTVLLNNGATVTGNITANGTLQFNQTGALTISSTISGTGTLSLTNTGTLNLTSASGGRNTVLLDMTTTVSSGLLQIRSASATAILWVGGSSTGTLNVTGGSVQSGASYLGYNAGSLGTATVSSGTWANNSSRDLIVGYSGTGTLTVTGGYVSNGSGYIGRQGGGVGTAMVSSGTWANASNLSVGEQGTGTLNVTGGYVSAGSGGAYLGYNPGGVGTATVSSGTLASAGNLTVGPQGTGTLNVTGGYVNNASGYIGYNVGGVGTANVSSGTWANSGDLVVGASGTGTLTMSGGLVSVSGTLSQGTSGTINLNSGGTLQIGVGGTTGVLGVSTLTNNGTLVFNRSDDSTYSGSITGSGSVTKQGGGRLTLAGPDAYSGRTTISGGTLALSGSGSIGTGGLDLGTNGIFDLAALASGTYSLPATGNLTGAGTLAGNSKTLAVLGSFLPGNSPGTVTLGSGFTLDLSSSGTSVFQITSPLYTASSFDLVNGTGSVTFGGILSLDFSGGTYAAGVNLVQIFANTGGVLGNFSSVVWTGLAEGQTASFNAATGFISISAVPEPSTCALALAGLAYGGYSLVRRRKRARHPAVNVISM